MAEIEERPVMAEIYHATNDMRIQAEQRCAQLAAENATLREQVRVLREALTSFVRSADLSLAGMDYDDQPLAEINRTIVEQGRAALAGTVTATKADSLLRELLLKASMHVRFDHPLHVDINAALEATKETT